MPDRQRDPIVRTIPQPADMNGNGDIFGGWVLSQMDMAGGTMAARAAKGRVATVAIAALTFVQPIKVGDLVSIYGSVTSIGDTAFYSCTSLTSVTIPGGVPSIGSRAFAGCTSLPTTTVPCPVRAIQERRRRGGD